MAKSMRQKMKLLYLMDILVRESDENHPVAISTLIDRLSALDIKSERKSLYDDIECLREFGIDIIHQPGKNGGYFVAEREFELPELKLLVDAVQSSKFITASKSDKLINKLGKLCSSHEERQLDRSVFVANRVKAMNESIYVIVDAIHAAMISNHKIRFRYFEWTKKAEKRYRRDGDYYIGSPWSLVWDDENYYLVAFDDLSGELRHFRVDKMVDIAELDEIRSGREAMEDFDSATYSKQMFGMYGGESEIVTLLCDNSLAGVIFDRFGTNLIPRFPDGEHFEIDVRVFVSPVFLGWVFGFGGKMKITSPESVQTAFFNTLKEQYKEVKKDIHK